MRTSQWITAHCCFDYIDPFVITQTKALRHHIKTRGCFTLEQQITIPRQKASPVSSPPFYVYCAVTTLQCILLPFPANISRCYVSLVHGPIKFCSHFNMPLMLSSKQELTWWYMYMYTSKLLHKIIINN